jgi:uncharacterized integral membrane protein
MKIRIFIILMLIVLFTIFVTQNTQIITVKVFFWQFTSPEIAIFVYTGVAGVLTGFILATIFRPSKKKKSNNEDSLPYGKKKDDLYKENV